MSGPFMSVNGVRVVSGSLTIPAYGAWAADFKLATPDPQTAAASVVIGNLTLTGTAIRTAPYAGAREWRGVAGYAGWRKLLTQKSYGNTNVMLSMVLGDAASELGEKVNVQNDVALGTGWNVLGTQTGGELLYQCAGNWYVDASGVTQIGSRPSAQIATPFQVIDDRSGYGLFDIATEDYASWQPGATFTAPTVTGTVTISSVTYTTNNEGIMRLSVLAVGEGVQ